MRVQLERRTQHPILTLAAHARARVIALLVCVCVSAAKSVSTVFLDNRDRFELQTWICFQVGCLDGKLRLWSGEAQGSWCNGPAAKVSVR